MIHNCHVKQSWVQQNKSKLALKSQYVTYLYKSQDSMCLVHIIFNKRDKLQKEWLQLLKYCMIIPNYSEATC